METTHFEFYSEGGGGCLCARSYEEAVAEVAELYEGSDQPWQEFVGILEEDDSHPDPMFHRVRYYEDGLPGSWEIV